MTTITVKQYVMLLTANHILASAARMTPDNAFGSTPYNCSPITRIYCTDGTSISVQAHSGAHCKFSDANCEGPFSLYASTFGKNLVMAETDCEVTGFQFRHSETDEETVLWHTPHGNG
jgi:hypothetical protein